MYHTIKALVLRTTVYNETDTILSLLTHDKGVVSAKVRGLRRKNSPLTAPCQLFAYSEFTIFENRGYLTVNDAHSIELFHNLRQDLNRLSLATYFVQVADLLSQEDMHDPDLLPLVLNCLYGMSELDLPDDKVRAVFELRCACISGYFPNLEGCIHCGEENPERFNLSAGSLECIGCVAAEIPGIRMPVTPSVLEVLRYICYCDKRKLFSFRASDLTLRRAVQLSEAYLETQLERGFTALDFYKSLNF